MKFLNSEGRIICLVERDDGDAILQRKLPDITLCLVPINIKEHIEESHIWKPILEKVKNGYHGVVYF